ncbi:hypothetical protein HMN09_00167900 [Mycena chlorophos]|uniref:BTB domain-containing protein n=1 Tax=Mycena chlorophos TaxID=658473 RepID=A0A8H6TS92_MYCCL|nr:hypothetical protein HMN09_00167900 [Mycena chlorophos]
MADTKETVQPLKTHSRYNLMGGDLHIIIDNIDFVVHRYFFDRESQKFREQLACPVSPGGTQQGSSQFTALKLTEVTAKQFEKFLTVFYNPLYTLYPHTSASDWADILSLAHRWEFAQVARLAIRELEKHEMATIERIALYQAHGLKTDNEVLYGHFISLCSRGYPLDLEEAKTLPLDTVVLVNQVMYALPKRARGEPQSPTGHGAPYAELVAKIVAEIYLAGGETVNEGTSLTSGASKPTVNGVGKRSGPTK